MEKQEFEARFGEGVDPLTWRIVESAYMNKAYDSFFPDKASVVEHFHKFGVAGFDEDFFADILSARAAIAKLLTRERKNLGKYTVSKANLLSMVIQQVAV